jgi:hypothetical protein
MKPVPTEAKRLPREVVQSGQVTKTVGHVFAWTEVQGKVTQYTQTEEGMGNGKPVYRIDFQCPRCEEAHYIHSDQPHAPPHLVPDPKGSANPDGSVKMVESGYTGHPTRCHCDASLVFRVLW